MVFPLPFFAFSPFFLFSVFPFFSSLFFSFLSFFPFIFLVFLSFNFPLIFSPFSVFPFFAFFLFFRFFFRFFSFFNFFVCAFFFFFFLIPWSSSFRNGNGQRKHAFRQGTFHRPDGFVFWPSSQFFRWLLFRLRSPFVSGSNARFCGYLAYPAQHWWERYKNFLNMRKESKQKVQRSGCEFSFNVCHPRDTCSRRTRSHVNSVSNSPRNPRKRSTHLAPLKKMSPATPHFPNFPPFATVVVATQINMYIFSCLFQYIYVSSPRCHASCINPVGWHRLTAKSPNSHALLPSQQNGAPRTQTVGGSMPRRQSYRVFPHTSLPSTRSKGNKIPNLTTGEIGRFDRFRLEVLHAPQICEEHPEGVGLKDRGAIFRQRRGGASQRPDLGPLSRQRPAKRAKRKPLFTDVRERFPSARCVPNLPQLFRNRIDRKLRKIHKNRKNPYSPGKTFDQVVGAPIAINTKKLRKRGP